MTQKTKEIIDYYRTKELILGGTKHFGYYPDAKGNTIALPPESLILDAGCGEGTTALRLERSINKN